MKTPVAAKLSRRERQIMEIIYQLEEASVADVVAQLDDQPTYDTIRVTLGILARKGHVSFRREDRRYIYSPTVPRREASQSAIRNLLRTFFAGSASKAILAMLDMSARRLSKKDLDEIAAWIEREKKST